MPTEKNTAAPQTRILIVDDDREFAASCKAVLEAENFAVLTAATGIEGLETAQRAQPHLIILDMMMATTSEGMEISRRIREHSALRNTPMIMITGARSAMHLPFKFEPDAHHLPVDAVLEKPIAPAELLREVRRQLQRKSV